MENNFVAEESIKELNDQIDNLIDENSKLSRECEALNNQVLKIEKRKLSLNYKLFHWEISDKIGVIADALFLKDAIKKIR